MPVNSIPYQPGASQLLAAYRPIVMKVAATSTGGDVLPPFVICDIYLNSVYYKSTIRTAPESTGTQSIFSFDISDALQEYLAPDLAQVGNDNILPAAHMSALVFCRFRSSGIDSEGFTNEEATVPVQATKYTAAVSGTGLQSNSFYAINSALQHEDNQNLAIHLNAYKQGPWAENAFPLTHRNKYFFCPGDSDHFPLVYVGDCLQVDLRLNYRNKGETAFADPITAPDIDTCDIPAYDKSVTGNQVTINFTDPLPAGATWAMRYKKADTDDDWTQTGIFATQSGTVTIGGTDIAGSYSMGIIFFCSACVSAPPSEDNFDLDGTETNLAWRGINPFCVQQVLPAPIYVVLDLRNSATEENYFPNTDVKLSKSTQTTADLYAKFYSDSTHLIPYNPDTDGMAIFVKKHETEIDTDGSGDETRTIVEGLVRYDVDVHDVEVLLGNVQVSDDIENYGPYPTITGSNNIDDTYTPFPTDALVGGNTGALGYSNLQQYNTDTGIATGTTKPNTEDDPDYIAPATDTITCPAGPNLVHTSYAGKLEVAKVEIAYGSPPSFVFAPTASNSAPGGEFFITAVPANVTSKVTVKARTLDVTNTTGFVKVLVNWVDTGVAKTQTFSVPNNIETLLPANFPSLQDVNISNS